MVETVVDLTSKNNTTQIANALTPIEAGLRQLALRQKMVHHLKNTWLVQHRIDWWYCEDIDNNMDCNYDSGDCCGCNVKTKHCSYFQCLDPDGSGNRTTSPQQQLAQQLNKCRICNTKLIVMALRTWTAKMIVETVVDVMSKQNTAQIANALILMEVGMEQHALNNNNNWCNNWIIAISATQDGLMMNIVMASIPWTAKMIVETVVDVTSKLNTAQITNTLPAEMFGGSACFMM